jgi:type I restriction enzyme, S subunit
VLQYLQTKKSLLSKDSGIDLNIMGFIPKNNIYHYFLYIWFQTIDLRTISDGSYIPQINLKNFEGIEVPLPPLEEQKKIAALFQSLETATEHMVIEENNLKTLQK